MAGATIRSRTAALPLLALLISAGSVLMTPGSAFSTSPMLSSASSPRFSSSFSSTSSLAHGRRGGVLHGSAPASRKNERVSPPTMAVSHHPLDLKPTRILSPIKQEPLSPPLFPCVSSPLSPNIPAERRILRQATTADRPEARRWDRWWVLPLAPFDDRKTLMKETVKGQVWSFDQKFGALYVQVSLQTLNPKPWTLNTKS